VATFELAAFTDEYSPNFDEQLVGMEKNGVRCMEMRGVDGVNVASLTPQKAAECKKKLDAKGFRVSSIGSPLGKISLCDPIEPHLEQLRSVIETAHTLGCDRIRVFSFYIPEGKKPEDCRGEVMERLGAMLGIAESTGVILCHENEKGIYGDTALRCLDIQKQFDSKIKLVFDHANFICCDDEPYPYAFDMLRDYIFYMHIKDATADKHMAPAGHGIGRFAETFAELNKYDRHFILTVEPHLQVFKGLDGLESAHRTKVENQYATSADAFKAAVDAIRGIITAL